VGQTYGSFVKRLVTIGWALTGLIVAAMIIRSGQHLEDPEMAFGFASRELLLPGLTGLMIAAIFAANMSSASNFMVNTGALFTQNFYTKYIQKNPTNKQLLRTGRISGVALTMLGVLFAIYIESVLHAFLFLETIAAFMGIIVFGGILWKRANRHGAITGVTMAFMVYYLLNYLDTGVIEIVYNWKPDLFGWAMLAGFGLFILVSLITKPEEEKQIEQFFDNMQRLSDEDAVDSDGNKPLARNHGKELMLVDLPSWFKKERWKNFAFRYREDWMGFLLAVMFIGVLIFMAWGILQI
jgi:SSS family solute:Na+ symporter